MFLTGQSTCLRASRTHVCQKPVVEFVRWRGKSAQMKKNEKDKKRGISVRYPHIGKSSEDSKYAELRTSITPPPKSNTTNRTPNAGKRADTNHSVRSNIKQAQLTARLIEATCRKQIVKFQRQYRHDPSPWGVTSEVELDELAGEFEAMVTDECNVVAKHPQAASALFLKFRDTFITDDITGLEGEIKHAFSNFIISRRLSEYQTKMHGEVSHLTHPSEWYPATRAMQRKVILHVGPTNSGKTYHALKRLEEAKSGVFAGPLRLLAHEVYTRFNAKNKHCALITGEEKRLPPGFNAETDTVSMKSCTVEMVPLNQKVDVCVIDEIQMIGDEGRGWAWTQAFLGVQAKELHLCGEERTVPLIKQLCALIGDEVEVNRYQRLSPLKAERQSLDNNLKLLAKGDCVIVFSRVGIHNMKHRIEKATGKLCAVVYGNLPPETRAQQAALFNDPNNDYDFLCASDAVGMGLNLSIKRVVFQSLAKYDGNEFQKLEIPQIKQIAGRAGRYRTAAQAVVNAQVPEPQALSPEHTKPQPEAESVGLVTTLFPADSSFLRSSLATDPGPIKHAGLFPSDNIVQKFASFFPLNTPFSYIIRRLHEIAKLNPRFSLCDLADQVTASEVTEDINLTVPERITLCAAPASYRMKGTNEVMRALAKRISEQSGGNLLDIPEIPLEILDEPEDLTSSVYLQSLEFLHNSINLYVWVSYRFTGVFQSIDVAFHAKSLVQDKISRVLAAGEGKLSGTKAARTATKPKPKLRKLDEVALEKALESMNEDEQQQEGEQLLNT